jgi:hypothetical protein
MTLKETIDAYPDAPAYIDDQGRVAVLHAEISGLVHDSVHGMTEFRWILVASAPGDWAPLGRQQANVSIKSEFIDTSPKRVDAEDTPRPGWQEALLTWTAEVTEWAEAADEASAACITSAYWKLEELLKGGE